jgi:transcriptional regulator
MYIPPSDSARCEDEWRSFLESQQFVTIIAPGANRDFPVVAPAHFVLEKPDVVAVHYNRANPIWAALEERPVAMVVMHDLVRYIPSSWNARPGKPIENGVPTSYYAALQLACDAEIIDDHEQLAVVLRALVERFQPEGGLAPIEAESPPYGQLMNGIRGLRLTIRDANAKFKFGDNTTPRHRRAIIARLREEQSSHDERIALEIERRLATLPPEAADSFRLRTRVVRRLLRSRAR